MVGSIGGRLISASKTPLRLEKFRRILSLKSPLLWRTGLPSLYGDSKEEFNPSPSNCTTIRPTQMIGGRNLTLAKRVTSPEPSSWPKCFLLLRVNSTQLLKPKLSWRNAWSSPSLELPRPYSHFKQVLYPKLLHALQTPQLLLRHQHQNGSSKRLASPLTFFLLTKKLLSQVALPQFGKRTTLTPPGPSDSASRSS